MATTDQEPKPRTTTSRKVAPAVIQELEPETVTSALVLTIVEPEPNDVLCGRGKHSFRHRGNYFFRHLIVEHVGSYKRAPTKKEKTKVVLLVATAIIARGGRFLVRNKKKDDSWRDGGLKQGQKKVGHAFRDALRGRVKCLQEKDLQEQDANPARASNVTGAEALLTGAQVNNVLKASGLHPTAEPSNDWTTPRTDAEMGKYLRSVFLFSKCTRV